MTKQNDTLILTLIYNETLSQVISKKQYQSWEDVSTDYLDYKANLSFYIDDLIEFLIDDWGVDDKFVQSIKDFVDSDLEAIRVIDLQKVAKGKLSFKELSNYDPRKDQVTK